VVNYEPAIDNRNPDFVVVLPTLGVLLVEVMGWYLLREPVARVDERGDRS
jgi:hypothetical protein